MVQTRRTRKHRKTKKSRRLKRQKGGNGIVATIILATEEEINTSPIQTAFESKFGTTIEAKQVSEDDTLPYMRYGNSIHETTIQNLLNEDAWGFSQVLKEKKFFYTFKLIEAPAYFSNASCSADARLTRFEGEIGLTFIDKGLSYQLIPGPHGLSDPNSDKYFFVGIHEGDSSKQQNMLEGYARRCS
jgi:hypothetical protein